MKKLVAVMSVLLFAGLESSAQDCNAILAQGMRNVRLSQSQASLVALKYSQNCGKDFRSMSDTTLASVEVSIFGEGSGSGSYSRDKREQALHQWCDTNKSTYESHNQDIDEANEVYAPSLDAWNKCNQLASNSVQILPTIAPNDQTVDVKVRYTGIGNAKLTGVPTAGFDCGYTGSAGNVVLPATLSTALINVHCTRAKAEDVTRGSNHFSKLSAATITIQTDADTMQLYFPDRWDPELPESEALRMRNDIDSLSRMVPTGTIWAYVGKTAPPGWAICDGSTVMRTGDFAQLFSVIGEKYGRGNGSTTFQLPNLQGRFMRGATSTDKVGEAGGVDALSGTVVLTNNDWKGSDYHWGETPWNNGPNPAKSGSYAIQFPPDSLPSNIQVLFIIKE